MSCTIWMIFIVVIFFLGVAFFVIDRLAFKREERKMLKKIEDLKNDIIVMKDRENKGALQGE